MSTPPKPGAPKARSLDNNENRVILLLDMDCFYAQCETVRLGLDPELPLALIQWNSALAVNYPARKYGIVRGDTFEKIREKSCGECVAIHLPVTTLGAISPVTKEGGKDLSKNTEQHEEEEDIPTEGEDVVSSYDAEFNQPLDVREEMYKREKNKMRSRNEGKACLDRYRLASARIFSLIDETLASHLGKKNYILERASIDELFIDVTAFCNNLDTTIASDPDGENDDKEGNQSTEMQFRSTCQTDALQSLKETTICDESNLNPDEIRNEQALVMGCHIARTVRRRIFDELKFTLSAGISTSKLVAKLGASYGKPNNQAVIFPGAIAKVMDETKIKKARMLGGKLGKKVLSLLPESETTMGSITRLLSLDDLIRALGEESGKWVFDACRGICTEEVKSTLKVLPKSITAFKSFSGLGYPELEKWTTLLAGDIMKRVELDSGRNNRMPKSCTLGYTTEYGGPWIGRSVRLPFPTDKDFDARVKRLVDGTRKVLTESGHRTLIRLGFSAIDFVTRPAKGIESFFVAGAKKSPPKLDRDSTINYHNNSRKREVKPSGIESFFSSEPKASSPIGPKHEHDDAKTGNIPKAVDDEFCFEKLEHQVGTEKDASHPTSTEAQLYQQKKEAMIEFNTTREDEEIARRLQNAYDNEMANNSPAVTMQPKGDIGRDKEIAQKLQASYDREHAVLSCVERFSSNTKRKKSGTTKAQKMNDKKCKIDSYFSLKK